MNCPFESGGNPEHLLDYAAGKLKPEVRARMEEHMAKCVACREFAGGQQAVWNALDAWEPAPVSMDFDRRLYARIEQENTSWWMRFTRRLDPLFRHAVPIGAVAAVLVMAGLLMNRPQAVPVPTQPQSAQVESLQADQVEAAVTGMEMLQEYNHLVADSADSKM